MSNFIYNKISSLFSSLYSFGQRFWSKDSLKRRRDSVDEDEEDDVLAGCQTLSKRRKCTNNKPNMASNNDAHCSSSQKKTFSHRKIQRNFQQMLKNSTAKENGSDNDIIEIVDNDFPPLEARAPLANLSVRAKAKSNCTDVSYRPSLNGLNTLKLHEPKNSAINTDSRKNGIHPQLYQSSFTSSLRFQKHSTMSKQTTLNETLKADDQRTYSAILADFHRPVRSVNSKTQDSSNSSREKWQLESSLKKMTPTFSKSMDFPVRSREVSKAISVPVKPWKSLAIDDDIEIIEVRNVPRVNSLEKKLSENSVVSPEWILDLKKRYNEKEMANRRQMKEAALKVQLCAEKNKDVQDALYERMKKHLSITEVVLDDTEEDKLPVLTPEMNKKIDSALKPHPPNEVLVEGFGQLIRRQDIKTLHHLNWLNDEVINFYMNLLVERGKEGKHPSVYAFNTFFYPKLVSQGYNSLRRWTKKVDVFAHELLLVPIHLGMHWCMAAIDFRDCTVRYYDSMGSENNKCLNALLKYLNEESLDKKKQTYDVSRWKKENVKDIPQQMNGSDCGMFSCIFAEYLSRNAKFTFSQKDMPYFRRKVVYEIISKQLLQ